MTKIDINAFTNEATGDVVFIKRVRASITREQAENILRVRRATGRIEAVKEARRIVPELLLADAVGLVDFIMLRALVS